MRKVGRKRKRKKRKVDKKHTNSMSRTQDRASRPAVSFAYLKVHHAAKNTKYKTRSISECYVRNNHATNRLKKKRFSHGFKCK